MAGVRRSRQLILIAAILLASPVVRACASCGCGDPTLTAMGVEKPFANRLRFSLEERFSGDSAGNADYLEETWTLRSSLTASFSPNDRFTIAALVPLMSIWTSVAGSAYQNVTGLGDSELMARAILWRERAWSPRHLISLMGGIKIPTAPRGYYASGYPAPDDVQPGSGSWDPFVGLGYHWFTSDLFSTFASLSYRYTTPGWHDYRRGESVGGTAGLQLQPSGRVAFAVSLDYRWAAADQLASGGVVANSGGSMLAITPSIGVAPIPDWLIVLSAQLHVAGWFNGSQTQSTTLVLSTVVDF